MPKEKVLLCHYTSFRIGGPAALFYAAKTVAELGEAAVEARARKLPLFVLGGGTNLLVGDRGFSGFVVKPAMAEIEVRGTEIHAEAGALMSDILRDASEHGLSGLEWAGGLPGTVGGAIRGNAGAFQGEIKDSVKEVESLEIGNPHPKVRRRTNADCRFGYRSSVFKERGGEEIVTAAVLQLQKGDKDEIRARTQEKIRYRKERHPMEYPNVGSIFKNVPLTQIHAEGTREYAESLRTSVCGLRGFSFPVKMDPFPIVPTAALIAATNLKGVSTGGAMVSPKHPNFIVNVLNATASDVKALIEFVGGAVKEKFSILLEEEVMYVGN